MIVWKKDIGEMNKIEGMSVSENKANDAIVYSDMNSDMNSGLCNATGVSSTGVEATQ